MPAEVGKRYHMVLDDCCVSLEFTAVLVRLEVDDGYLVEAVFDNGVTVTEAQYTLDWEEVDDAVVAKPDALTLTPTLFVDLGEVLAWTVSETPDGRYVCRMCDADVTQNDPHDDDCEAQRLREWSYTAMSALRAGPEPGSKSAKLLAAAREHGLCSCDPFGGPRPLGNGQDYHYVGCDHDPELRAAIKAIEENE